jgi:hypothetical protein
MYAVRSRREGVPDWNAALDCTEIAESRLGIVRTRYLREERAVVGAFHCRVRPNEADEFPHHDPAVVIFILAWVNRLFWRILRLAANNSLGGREKACYVRLAFVALVTPLVS